MKQAIYPGSFDPITLGHLDIITRACDIFDKVIVCVMINPDKKPIFTNENKIEMVRQATEHLKNVEIDFHGGLLADYAKKREVYTIIRGLRSSGDLESEHQTAVINNKLCNKLETICLLCKDEHRFVSSTTVRLLISLNADFSFFVCEKTERYIKKLLGGSQNV